MTFEALQKKIGVTFTNEKLLKQAFVHRSFLNESEEFVTSNERLEFLGDAILSFVTSHYLYETYPQFPEGTLTNIRSALVKTKTLSNTAKALNLGELLMLSHGEESSGGRNNDSLLADCFESLLGAMYLDSGIDTARAFLQTFLLPQATDIVQNKSYIDYKSLLQELVQEHTKLSPTYRVTKSEGPDHSKMFWVEVLTGTTVLGEGKGKSKQEAEQQAASAALEKYPQT